MQWLTTTCHNCQLYQDMQNQSTVFNCGFQKVRKTYLKASMRPFVYPFVNTVNTSALQTLKNCIVYGITIFEVHPPIKWITWSGAQPISNNCKKRTLWAGMKSFFNIGQSHCNTGIVLSHFYTFNLSRKFRVQVTMRGLWREVNEFFSSTSIHGFPYINDSHLRSTRIIWTIIVLAGFSVATIFPV